MAIKKIVVLATGGTIAGVAPDPARSAGYRAAELGVEALLAGVAPPAGCVLEAEQAAQIDSKDMSLDVWQTLLARCVHWLEQPEVAGLVITHGTDALEETAWLLQTVLAPTKPVVLTGAMRPANAPDADGPRNLRDALQVAASGMVGGVLAVCAGQIHGAREVQKIHPTRLDAFSSGEAGPLGCIADGVVRLSATSASGLERVAAWPADALRALLSAQSWPRVEIVLSHAMAGPALVDVLLDDANSRRLGAPPVQGLVAAGAGNGSLHASMEPALRRALAAGVRVVRVSRCPYGYVSEGNDMYEDVRGVSAVKARVTLMLDIFRQTLSL